MSKIKENTFAAACIRDNFINELVEALAGDADKTDCETWGITPKEWREEIALAIKAKVRIAGLRNMRTSHA